MKTVIKSIAFLSIVIVSMASCCVNRNSGGLIIRNNSEQTIYYWYAHWLYNKDYKNYHYPDTILPVTIPTYDIWPIHPHDMVEASSVSRVPNYEKIFSNLPEGKFTVYFFAERPETQEAWDLIRENYNMNRKDVTYQEFMDNEYIIDYP